MRKQVVAFYKKLNNFQDYFNCLYFLFVKYFNQYFLWNEINYFFMKWVIYQILKLKGTQQKKEKSLLNFLLIDFT